VLTRTIRTASLAVVAWLALGGVAGATENELAEARALLQAGKAEEAAEIYRQILEADPDIREAHIGLGRAYLALGEYALAKIAFETVLFFDDLPRDVHEQVEIYAETAPDGAEDPRFRPFFYGESGLGHYRENSTPASDLFGKVGPSTFVNLNTGGGWAKDLNETYTFNGSLDYEFRWYDDSDIRNDSDLFWNFNLSRPVDDDNLRFGVRGRVSYRGDGLYRNDFGLFADYRVHLSETQQLNFNLHLRTRRYPSELRDRTRDNVFFSPRWTIALNEGRTSLDLHFMVGRSYETHGRPDGDSDVWSTGAALDHSFTDDLSTFIWFEYESESFSEHRTDLAPANPDIPVQRNDDLYYAGAGLVWQLGSGWSLRPELLYEYEDSNLDALTYSGTEIWVDIRKRF
jgi:tetratricopeptide (TPR) repeat protein